MTRVTEPVPLRQPLEVGADGLDAEQQPLQGRGDRDLAHRLGQRAVADHQPLGADREVAADRVDAGVEAGHRVDEQPELDAGDELVVACRARARSTAPGSRRPASSGSPAPPSRSTPRRPGEPV